MHAVSLTFRGVCCSDFFVWLIWFCSCCQSHAGFRRQKSFLEGIHVACSASLWGRISPPRISLHSFYHHPSPNHHHHLILSGFLNIIFPSCYLIPLVCLQHLQSQQAYEQQVVSLTRSITTLEENLRQAEDEKSVLRADYAAARENAAQLDSMKEQLLRKHTALQLEKEQVRKSTCGSRCGYVSLCRTMVAVCRALAMCCCAENLQFAAGNASGVAVDQFATGNATGVVLCLCVENWWLCACVKHWWLCVFVKSMGGCVSLSRALVVDGRTVHLQTDSAGAHFHNLHHLR